MKKLLFLLLIINFSSYAQKDTTTIKRKVVKVAEKFYVETTTNTVSYQEFNVGLIESIDRKDDDEIFIKKELQRKNKELVDKTTEKNEFQKYFKDAMKQGYKPDITNSREQEVYEKVLKKIK